MKKLFTCFFISLFLLTLSAKSPVPDGYKDIKLGMSLQETKEELLKDIDFGYHGDRDVSLVPGVQQVLIETDASYGHGSNFLTNCFFQFSQDSLYIITINFNPDRLDYYSVFTTLTNKYGQPDSFSPTQAVWKNDTNTMSLERPLTLKYIDNQTFQSLQSYSNVPLSGTEITKEMFLDQL